MDNPRDFRTHLIRYVKDNHYNDYLFSPLNGIGDRITFYSFFREFSRVHKSIPRVLCFDQLDPLLDFYPTVKQHSIVLVDPGILKPIDISHWIYGAKYPSKGSLYFTWHGQYLDGIFPSNWETSDDNSLNHKTLIRLILGISLEARPDSICLKPNPHDDKKLVVLAPIQNSNPTDLAFFVDLAARLTREKIRVVWNLGNQDARQHNVPVKSTAIAEIIRKSLSHAEMFQGNIVDLMNLCSESTNFTVTARSGLCELLALSNAKYAVISAFANSAFWTLDGWGCAPTVESNPTDLNIDLFVDQITNLIFSEERNYSAW